MSEKKRNKYALKAFLIVVFLMAINPQNCSAGRNNGMDEYLVRVLVFSLILGFFVSSATWLIQWLREK